MSGEAGGGLHEIRARIDRDRTGVPFLIVRQQSGFEDDLEQCIVFVTRFRQQANLFVNRVSIPSAKSADVDHHVDLRRAGMNGVARLIGFHQFGSRAQGKSGDGADFYLRRLQLRRGEADPVRIDTNAEEAVLHRLLAQTGNIATCGVRL